MNNPPPIQTPFEALPTKPDARHEFLVDIFGTYFAWAIEQAMSESKTLVQDSAARSKLGRARASPYAQAAEGLSEQQRAIAYELSRQTLENFSKVLLCLLTAQGISHPLGSKHAIQFRLIMDICKNEDLQVVLEETLNRGGKKVFNEYLSHWIHKGGQSGPP